MKQKEIFKEIIYIKEKQIQNLIQKMEIPDLENFQGRIEEEKWISLLQNLEKSIENLANTTKSNWESLPKMWQEVLEKNKDWESFSKMLQEALEKNREILLAQFFPKKEEENIEKEHSLHKKLLQGQRQSLLQILENWEKKQEEKQKDFALFCKGLQQLLAFLKFLKKSRKKTRK